MGSMLSHRCRIDSCAVFQTGGKFRTGDTVRHQSIGQPSIMSGAPAQNRRRHHSHHHHHHHRGVQITMNNSPSHTELIITVCKRNRLSGSNGSQALGTPPRGGVELSALAPCGPRWVVAAAELRSDSGGRGPTHTPCPASPHTTELTTRTSSKRLG